MVDLEHLDILRQGNLNTWRQEHPGVRPDLSRANLSKVELIGTDLSGANLICKCLDSMRQLLANYVR